MPSKKSILNNCEIQILRNEKLSGKITEASRSTLTSLNILNDGLKTIKTVINQNCLLTSNKAYGNFYK